uniref:Membrane-associated guanylate kinase, WW and PDZ domain-containing protein 1 n=1 Tax=Strigamia maritima TaxID=126957 RepID=T1JEL2_STRMM
MPSGSDQETIPSDGDGHWSSRIEEVVLTNEGDCPLNLHIDGGSDNGEFVCVGDRSPPGSAYLMGRLSFGDVILEIQGQKTAGYTQRDVVAWLNHCCRNGNPVTIKTIPEGLIVKDLRQYLTSRFPKGSPDHDLQNTIRDNLYLRTVPCTTRPPRDGEVNGVDYCFLSPEEFMILERSGKLLESGIFEGNHYGTPKPPKENPVYVGAYSNDQLHDFIFLPGAHASSEGKRRRNRSNVEAMSGSLVDSKPERHQQPVLSKNGLSESASLDTLPPFANNDDLGQLPPHWEKAYTETGEPYFIDHRTGTSHWLDPRLAKIKKKTIEDCNDDELPYGWEKIDDAQYGTYYIDHVNRKTQYENPVLQAKFTHQNSNSSNNSISAADMISISNLSITKQSEISDSGKHESNSQSGLSLYLPCLPCVNDTQDKSCSTPPIPISSEPDETSKSDSNMAAYSQMSGSKAIFTKNPAELKGEFIRTILVKSNRGFGFTIVGGDGETEEFLQIKNVVVNGPAWADGRLKTGDVLVFVNDICVLGSFHQDIVRLFQSFVPGETVELEVCRGYLLQFDLDNPDNEVITTVAVSSIGYLPSASAPDTLSNSHFTNGVNDDGNRSLQESNIYNTVPNRLKKTPDILDFQPLVPPKPDFLMVRITKGNNGFGFTIADSAYGQKVKKILDQTRCQNLLEGDILVAINNHHVKDMQHSDVVQVLKNCPQNLEATISIQRGSGASNSKMTKSNSEIESMTSKINGHHSILELNNSGKEKSK